ncbi:MAG: hypothetical protein JW820_09645 [Spirochaetales bacterium]|nr:hypothetical protein [Spirochaetales bacterium]
MVTLLVALRKPVRRLFLALVVAAVALALGSCALFTDSLFPWYLSGVTDTLDLSTWIDEELVPEDMDENEWGLNLAVLRDAGGRDRVFVGVYGYMHTRLIILNSDLTLAAAAENPLNDQPIGRRALVDAGGNYVIGETVIDGVTLQVLGAAAGGSDTMAVAVPGVPGNNYTFWVDNGVSPAMLYHVRYDASWGGGMTFSPAQVSADSYVGFDLAALAYDDQRPSGQQLALLLRSWGGEEDSVGYIVYLDETMVSADLLAPVLDSYPGFTVTPRRGVERMRYTRKGIVVREGNDDCTLYRFSEDDTQSLSFATRHEILDAYDIDGEHFYVLDKDERMLYKGRTGW